MARHISWVCAACGAIKTGFLSILPFFTLRAESCSESDVRVNFPCNREAAKGRQSNSIDLLMVYFYEYQLVGKMKREVRQICLEKGR